MRKIFVTLFFGLILSLSTYAQQIDYNTKKGFVVHGYDVTEYFNDKAIKGNSKYVATYDNVKYKFFSQENLDKFNSNPDKYMPQYGGYCAYAIALKAKKIGINPKTFEIRDNKLYLFYNSMGINTLKKWIEKDAEKLVIKADKNWLTIKNK